jgi:hypothetical protein
MRGHGVPRRPFIMLERDREQSTGGIAKRDDAAVESRWRRPYPCLLCLVASSFTDARGFFSRKPYQSLLVFKPFHQSPTPESKNGFPPSVPTSPPGPPAVVPSPISPPVSSQPQSYIPSSNDGTTGPPPTPPTRSTLLLNCGEVGLKG